MVWLGQNLSEKGEKQAQLRKAGTGTMICYEDLVTEPDNNLRRIVDFCEYRLV